MKNLVQKIPEANTFIQINQYNTDKQNLEKKIGGVGKKIPDMRGLVTAAVLNTNIREVENKIPDTSSLVNTTVLNAEIGEVENETPDHAKFITTPKFTKLKTENFAARLKQDNLMNKTDFDNKLISYNRKINSSKTRYLKVKKN